MGLSPQFAVWAALVLSLLLVGREFRGAYAAAVVNTDPQVQQLQAMIRSGTRQGAPLGLLHLQLAMHLQQLWFSKKIGGNALSQALDAYDEAFRLMQSAREARKAVEIAYHRGLLLKVMGRGEESLSSYREALQYALNSVDLAALRYNIADCELMLGRVDAALREYDKALSLAPCKTERYFGYVSALREKNALSPADWAALAERLRDVETKCGAWEERRQREREKRRKEDALQEKEKKRNKNKKSGTNDALLNALDFDEIDDESERESERESHAAQGKEEEEEELWDRDFLPSYLASDAFFALDESAVLPAKHSDLLYAIYIAADQARDRETAWQYLVRANDAEKTYRSEKFDRETAMAMKNTTLQVFTSDLIDSFPDIADKASRVPIFVIGMMRSGSTLMETMLDAHPLIWGMGEDSVFNGNLTYLRDAMVQVNTDENSQKRLESVLLDFGQSTVQGMKKMVRQTVGEQAKGKTKNANKDWKKMRHIVDKMLFNYRNIGFINAVFPDALIVHMIRDPLDTLFSMYRQKFDDQGLEWSLDVKDLVLQFALYLEYMAHFRELLPGRVVDVRYEELVSDPERVLRELVVKKLRLPWDPKVLEFHSSQRVVLTNSQSQVRQKLYKHSMGGWRAYADQLQVVVDEWKRYLPRLKKKKALPFADKVNWDMDRHFDYERERESTPVMQSNLNSRVFPGVAAKKTKSHVVIEAQEL